MKLITNINRLEDSVKDNIVNFIKKYWYIILPIIAIIFSTLGKVFLYKYDKFYDWIYFLHPWMTQWKELGILTSLRTTVGNYPMIYDYFLIIIANTTPESFWLTGIKLIDLVFEISASLAIFSIVNNVTHNVKQSSIAFSISLFLPTILLNGPMCGQCDIIFVSFILWMIYFFLEKKSLKAMIMFAFAISFKLQTIYVLPFLIILFLKKKVKFTDIIIAFVVYLILIMPAVIAGHNFLDAFFPWFINVQGIMDYGRTSQGGSFYIFFIFCSFDQRVFTDAAFAFFLLPLSIYLIYFIKNDFTVDKKNIILISLLSTVMCPYFMPLTLQRYFFIADLLSFIFLLITLSKNSLLIFLLINISSVFACGDWIFNGYGGLGQEWCFIISSLINLVAFVLILREVLNNSKHILKNIKNSV